MKPRVHNYFDKQKLIIGFIVETLREEGQLTNYWEFVGFITHLPALYDVMYGNLE